MTMINALAIVVSVVFTILSFLFVGWESRFWKPPMDRKEKISRSIGTGLGSAIGVIGVLTIFDLTRNPTGIENWSNASYLGLLCIGIPIILVASIGTFIGFTMLDTLRRKT